MLQPDRYTRVAWDCVHFESTSIVDNLAGALAATSRTYVMDAIRITDTGSMVNAVARAMACPAYISNPDGLLEFLRTAGFDFSEDDNRIIGKVQGILLIVRNATRWFARSPESAGMLISLWLSAAEDMSTEGIAAHLIFEIDETMVCG